MSMWVHACLSGIAVVLAEVGRLDLLSGLQRIREAADLDALPLTRFAETDQLAEKIMEAAEVEDLLGLLRSVAAYFEAAHCTLHVVGERPGLSFSRRVLTTYSAYWVQRYFDRRYVFIDPVPRMCRAGVREFFWEDIAPGGVHEAAFWKDARAHGVGPSGYTLCEADPDTAAILAVSLGGAGDPAAFRAAIERKRDDLGAILRLLLERFQAVAKGTDRRDARLVEEQLVLLRAVADGRRPEGKEGGLHEAQGPLEQSVLRALGARTMAQAAVLATQLGLLSDLPLRHDDIEIWTPDTSAPDAIA